MPILPHPARLLLLLSLALANLVPLRAADPSDPITDDECAEFGLAIAGLFNTQKQELILKSFDGYALSARIFTGLDVEEKFKEEFNSGFIPSVTSSLTNSLKQFSSARYLRNLTVAGEQRALIRMVGTNGAVNYMALAVARRASGSLKWIDCVFYVTGEDLSVTTRRAIMPVLAQQNQSFLTKLTSEETVYVNSMEKLTAANELLQAGKFAESSQAYENLPEVMSNAQWILLLRLRCAQQLGNDAQLKVVSLWEKLYPKDPALAIVSIDAHLIRQNFPAAIKAVQQLDALVGGDPYLTFLTGNIHLMAGDHELAKKSARAALATEPTIYSAWDTLLGSTLAEKKYAEMVTVLDDLAAALPGAKMKPVIDREPTYADFRASEEYKTWAARQP